MKAYPFWPFSWNHIVCDAEDDLKDNFPAEPQPGDEAFVRSTNKTYTRTTQGTWLEKGSDLSIPPSGKCKVSNLYVDPVTGKLVIEYDTTPVP